eukprot:g7991.t1
MTAAASGNGGIVSGAPSGGSSGSGIVRRSSAKQRAFPDEGGSHSITATASSSGGGIGAGDGAPGTRIALPSPPKKRGVPSGASFKILQAATGVAVIPAPVSPASPMTQDTQPEPPQMEETTQATSAELEAGCGIETCTTPEGEEAGISLVTTATATATTNNTNSAAGVVPAASSCLVVGSEEGGDVESGSGPPLQPQQLEGDGAGLVHAETKKTARI